MDFSVFLKIWVKILVKIYLKNAKGKYSQKLLNHAKQSAADALKTASKKSNSKSSRGNW